MHAPVLLEESLAWLAVRADGVYVDCTAGAGGHSEAIARRLDGGRLIAIDRDPSAAALAAERLRPYPGAQVIHGNYGDAAALLAGLGIARADGVLIDAGVSSMQLDQADRGFSLQEDGPLDMRMDTTAGPTAAEWLAGQDEPGLAAALRTLGDVGPAKRIARAILARRDGMRLATTADLAAAVAEGLGLEKRPRETYNVFQAIRMAVNEELRWLEAGLEAAIAVLAPGGRLAAISFHSGEDRVVKHTLQRTSRRQRTLGPDGRVTAVVEPTMTVLTKKPIAPGAAEIAANPRSRSAKLRAAERRKE